MFHLLMALLIHLIPIQQGDACVVPDGLSALVADVQTALDSGDLDAALTSYAALQSAFAELRTACQGLSFSSETDGLQPVIGPVVIPDGIYRMTVTSDGMFALTFEILSGECDWDLLSNLAQGRASEGVQGLVRSNGCETLIQLGHTTEAWTLTFEPIQ